MSEAGQNHVHTHGGTSHITPYSTRYATKTEISKFKIPHKGAPADAVHQMLKDELDLDGRPNLNLASFVGTYMETHAEQLMFENISKNMSDADEYPASKLLLFCCLGVGVDGSMRGNEKGYLLRGGDFGLVGVFANICVLSDANAYPLRFYSLALMGCSEGRKGNWIRNDRI